MPPERLLAHEGFLRALALQLVGGASAADDVVQGTWLKALERPPAPGVPLRGWLATVARNVARMGWRGEARRRRREHAVARPEAEAPSVESVRARERARQAVVEAVLRLDAPYRAVVLLRFYEGLPPREVAARLDLPLETVRTRLRRAVERLRADVDSRHGRAGRAILAPLALPRGACLTSTLTATVGALSMSLKTRAILLGTGVLLAFGAGAGLWLAEHRPGASEDEGPDASATSPGTAPGQTPGAPRLEGSGDPGRTETPAPGGPPRGFSRLGRPLANLRGRVLSGRNHLPVGGARVAVIQERGATPPGMQLKGRSPEGGVAQTDEHGRFELHDLPVGAYWVRVRHDVEGVADLVAHAGPNAPVALLHLMPEDGLPHRLHVRVLAADGTPAADAEVVAEPGPPHEPWTATTDGEGRVVLSDVGRLPLPARGWGGTLRAQKGGALAAAALHSVVPPRGTASDPLTLRLQPPAVVEGRLGTADGRSLAGGRVSAWPVRAGRLVEVDASMATASLDATGAFRLEGLPEGTYLLCPDALDDLRPAWPPAGEPLDPGRLAPWVVTLQPGSTTRIEADLVVAAGLEGRVLGPGGAPVVGALVHVAPRPGTDLAFEASAFGGAQRWAPRFWNDVVVAGGSWAGRELVTDAQGRYVATDLRPGTYHVRVATPDERVGFHVVPRVELADGRRERLEHRLEPGGSLELAARPGTWLGLRRAGQSSWHAVVVVQEGPIGAVTVPGLAVGAYEAFQVHSSSEVAPVLLGGFEIEAGAVTYVDLSSAGDRHLRVRVTARGAPVAGALLHAPQWGWGGAFETDADGRVAWTMTTFQPLPQLVVLVEPPGPNVAPVHAVVPQSAEPSEIALPSGGLLLRVLDAQGRPASSARLQVRPMGPATAPATGTFWPPYRSVDLTADALGVARLHHVAPGRYEIAVEVPGGAGHALRTVQVGQDVLDEEVRAAAPGRVRLRVRHADGRPAAGVRVALRYLPADGPSARWEDARDLTQQGWATDAEGHFIGPWVGPGRLRASAWVLPPGALVAESNAQGEIDLQPGATLELDLGLRPLAR